MKTLVKILSWLLFLVSGGYLFNHFGYWPGLAIITSIAGLHMISWIDDKEKGRLR